jgi:hypothetical protein
MGHIMRMNETTKYNLPSTGIGNYNQHSFEWSIHDEWAKVVFPGASQNGYADIEVECMISDDGYFSPELFTQTWCETQNENVTWHNSEKFAMMLEEIRPFFSERYIR